MENLIRFMTFEEFKEIYKACKDKKLKLAISLGFGAGLRISEIIGYKRKKGVPIPPLEREQVDLKTHQIKVLGAKGNKWRITVTPPSLGEENLSLLPLKINRRTLQYQFEQLTKKVLGRKLSFHTLRHGFGNYQANVLGISLPIVQSMMGHSRLDTTGIYTKANPEQAINTSWKAMIGEN